MILPSDCGLNPRSEVWMAFSISFRIVGSHGAITISCASGADTCASWLIGVWVP